MSLTTSASVLACILFVGAMLHVVATDLLYRRIRNWVITALIAAYAPLAIAAGVPPGEAAMAVLAAAVVFAAGFGCFAAGWIGGGDAKLAPVCVLWLGADQALPFLVLTSLLGGVLALALLAIGALRRGHAAGVGTEPLRTIAPTLPYGLALAAAALILLRESPWVAAI